MGYVPRPHLPLWAAATVTRAAGLALRLIHFPCLWLWWLHSITRSRQCGASLLQVGGKVSYNGHELHEFLPERTAVYVEQEDQHMPELTVRETLNFSARCQGTGSNAGAPSFPSPPCVFALLYLSRKASSHDVAFCTVPNSHAPLL